MNNKICFGIWGCGRPTDKDKCPHCENETRLFDSLEYFMRECGKLPTLEAFRRAYKAVTQIEPGLMAEEHYRRKHEHLDIVGEDEKEKAKDPYMDKFHRLEQPKIEIIQHESTSLE